MVSEVHNAIKRDQGSHKNKRAGMKIHFKCLAFRHTRMHLAYVDQNGGIFHYTKYYIQSSGFGVKGSVGRCYPFWSAFEKCLATADHFKECMDFRDDYVECLHHRKEVGLPCYE